MRLRVCLLCLLLPLILGANPARTLATGSPLADLHLLRSAAVRMGRQPMVRVIRWLDKQSAVRRAEVGLDGRTLDIHFRDGQEMLVLPARDVSVRLPAIREPQQHRLSRQQQSGVQRAAVLTPFAAELGYAGTGDIEAGDLQNAGFNVDQVSNSAVTVSLLQSLSRYNVVYMHTHSGTTSGGDGVLATGQPANGDASLTPLLQDGSVLPVGVAGDNNTYYAVTSRLFAQHVGAFPHDSLLFLNGCKLLPATAFWQALSAKGAGAMVSWSEDAQAKDDYLSGAGFFNFLAQGMSVDAAIAALKASGFGTSEYNGITASLGYRGDGTITLSRAARGQGPAATSTPTAEPSRTPTAVAPSPTATWVVPTPTAARPSVPLRMTALHTVLAPKQVQQLTVQTSAALPVALTVTFPDGRRLSQSRTADAAGTAAFSFAQPKNSITRHNNRAEISVQAGQGADLASLSGGYTIGYSLIDLSIEPRSAAPGSAVVLWVHTLRATSVEGHVQAPKRKLIVLHGKTGPQGWASLAYRIPKGLATGQRISVSAAAKRQGRTVSTSAKLVIR